MKHSQLLFDMFLWLVILGAYTGIEALSILTTVVLTVFIIVLFLYSGALAILLGTTLHPDITTAEKGKALVMQIAAASPTNTYSIITTTLEVLLLLGAGMYVIGTLYAIVTIFAILAMRSIQRLAKVISHSKELSDAELQANP